MELAPSARSANESREQGVDQGVQGDLREAAFVRSLGERRGPFDSVHHLGAYAAEGLSHFIRASNYTTNLVASMHRINESIKSRACRCFVFASSIAVYGPR